MASAKKPKLPPSTEARAEVLRLIHESTAPLAASTLVKSLLPPHKIPAAQLEPILEEYVTAGTLYRIPAAKATGKPRYWDRDLIAILRAGLAEALHAADAPLTAPELATRIARATATTEGDVTPLLEEGIAAGRLFRYPPKTKAGKPRYWDRDLIAIVRAGLAETLHAADAPLTAHELAARIAGATAATEGEVTPLLDEGVAAGRLFRFPPKAKTGKPRYWDRDQIAAVRAEILKFLETKGPQKLAPLRKVAGSLETAQCDTLLEELRAAGQLFSHPPLGKAKEPLFAIRPVSPQPYLQEVEKSLALVVEKLQRAQVSEEELRRAIVQMVESAGVRFGGVPGTRAETTVTTPAATFDLIALMKRIEPGAERGALVGAGELRRVAGVSKEEFDQTALALSRAGRLSLHRHNFVGNLSTEERDLLVTDGAGNYFVGMALRQNNG